VPEEVWAEVVKVASVEGVDTTARALRLNRSRLEARMKTQPATAVAQPGGGFVELDAGRLGLSPRPTVVRLEGRDGERLEIELGVGAAVDLAALAEAFWRRRR
jgi:hypothetical protein